MRILHVYKDYFPVVGGIENHIKLLAEAQAVAGHEVTVLTTNRSRNTSDRMLNGVRVLQVGRIASVASTPISLRLFLQIPRLAPDITHLHFPYPPGEVAQYLLGKSRHTVISYHSDVVRQARLLALYRPFMERVLGKAERILVSSQAYLESSPVLPRYAAKCVIIPYGIDQTRLQREAGAQVAVLRKHYGPGPLLLFVGVLRYYKGLQYLLQAMPTVKARLLIVGDGPQDSVLRQQSYQLGLSDRVFFAGQVSDDELSAYYQAADMFVLPASERSEAFGLVLVEALASGLPIISTELHTGTSFVNQDGETGIVVPPKDPLSLAKAINRLVDNIELRQVLARGALARAPLFRAERMLSAIEAVYQEIAAQQV